MRTCLTPRGQNGMAVGNNRNLLRHVNLQKTHYHCLCHTDKIMTKIVANGRN